MKKTLLFLLVLCLVFTTACGGPSPTDIVKLEFDYAQEHPEEIIGEIDSSELGEESTRILIEKILDYEYQLGEENIIDDDSATVETTITTYPFKTIMESAVTEVAAKYMANPNMTEEEIMAAYAKALADALAVAEKTYTETVSIPLEKEDGTWEMQDDDDFLNALSGGLGELQ